MAGSVKLKYVVAGWMAIVSAVLLVPYAFLSLVFHIRPDAVATLLPISILIVILQMTCSVFAFIQFRNLLNERYRFHEVDTLVPILIFGGIAITFVLFMGFILPALKIPALIVLIVLDIPVSIVGILFGVRLLRLKAKLHGLLQPLAYTHILGSIFFLTLILGTLGLLVMAVFELLLGILFLRGEEGEEVEFV